MFLRCIAAALIGLISPVALAGDLAAEFAHPPESARPWVYWFWKNGNIDRDGITADLEAMDRAGLGGVILMEVALSTPPGPITFFSQPWRELFQHAVAEADRLGLQVTINSAPGWTGSGGPWVKPEQSMQKVVASETAVEGPRRFEQVLLQPETVQDFYRDIAVLAFPTPEGDYRIADIREKAIYERGPFSSMPGVRAAFPGRADYQQLPAEQVIDTLKIVDLTSRLDDSGRLDWDVPPGRWTILRFGTTSTGQTNRPAALPGLECDKLDRAALDEHFRQFTAQLVADVGGRAGRTLVATHLDSWEVGGQNWTAAMRGEFSRRRGYDLLPYLPVMTGRVVGSLEISERFLWDLRQTVSEMIVEYHGRHMRELAHRHGLSLSIEPYDMTPCDNMSLGAAADVPMCEFWSNTFDTRYSVREATSIAHVYGKPIVAAEAFTSVDGWELHPAAVKPLGDWAFSEGVNRMVVHRYVHQPFAHIGPGLSLGPHGLHYERTQTWWELSSAWHEYLARCQHLLRQGEHVADILYLSPEGAPNVFQGPKVAPDGYKYDACTPEALLSRVRVRDSRLTLPHGASYRLLVLPDSPTMTPELLAKVRQLIEEGAIVVGRPPQKSPSLAGYPACDDRIRHLARPLGVAGAESTEVRLGKGRIFLASAPQPSSRNEDLATAVAQSRWIWHADDQPAARAPVGRRYFRRSLAVAPGEIQSADAIFTADNSFQLWVNGKEAGSGTSFRQFYVLDISTLLRPGENTLAVEADNASDAPNPAGLLGAIVTRYRDGTQKLVHTDGRWQSSTEAEAGWTTAASDTGWAPAMDLGPIGMSPWGQPSLPTERPEVYPEARQIASVLRQMGVVPDFESSAALRYAHRRIGDTDVYFVSNGQSEAVEADCLFRIAKRQPELWHPETGAIRELPTYGATDDGRTSIPLRLDAAESFFVVFRSPAKAGGARGGNFPVLRPLMRLEGPWQVTFDAAYGGQQEPITFTALDDWSQRPEERIKHYSGRAVYRKQFNLPKDAAPPGAPLYLNLGRVEVMAHVRLNGRDIGIVWKSPFRIDITTALRPGANALELEVVNLWPNRLIGDESLPRDPVQNANGTWREWPHWLLNGQPAPTGRHTFAAWNHWKPDSPLLPSGLLGPVSIETESAAPIPDNRRP